MSSGPVSHDAAHLGQHHMYIGTAGINSSLKAELSEMSMKVVDDCFLQGRVATVATPPLARSIQQVFS